MPRDEEARRILDRLNHLQEQGQVEKSKIELSKKPAESSADLNQTARIGWDAFRTAYQNGSDEQKRWLDSDEAGLLARRIVDEASMDPESTKIRAGLIRVISSYYLRLIQPNELAAHIQIESGVDREIAERIVPNIIQNILKSLRSAWLTRRA